MYPRSWFALVAMVGLIACKAKSGDSAAGEAPKPSSTEASQRLYVQASTLNLRAAPAPEAEVLEKLPIGTECLTLGPVQGEWRKVRCGPKEGHVSASLLGEAKPDVEKLKAEADNASLTLEQRQDSALRAALLAPEDPVRFTVLRERFLERNLEILASAKKRVKGQPFQVECFPEEDAERCLAGAAAEQLRGVRSAATVQKNRFVVAVGNAERIDVYRGRVTYDKDVWRAEGAVLERTSFTPTPVMEKALFLSSPAAAPDTTSPRPGQFVLDAPSRALLEGLPESWYLLVRTGDGAWAVQENACERRAFFLWLSSDVHGRWRLEAPRPGAPTPETFWVSAVTRQEGRTRLRLARGADDTDGPVFEVPPEGGDDVATLGGQAYASGPSSREKRAVPCGADVEGADDAFDGEFTSEEAMKLLYGRFDAAAGASVWVPTVDERNRFSLLNGFAARHFVAKPWHHEAYTQGDQEKVLFLTETPSNEPTYHGSGGIIGGGVFVKTDTGWRLERANRAILSMGSFGSTGGPEVVLRAVEGKGFIASLSSGFTATGMTEGWLLLLSDVGPGQHLRVVARVDNTYESNEGACEYGDGGEEEDEDERMRMPRCYEYDSTWELKENARNELPDVVITTQGTHRPEGGDSQDVESYRRVRTLSYESGSYR